MTADPNPRGPSLHRNPTLSVAVQIPAAGLSLEGDLSIPHPLRGAVLFAHGSGSSRHSPRNQFVARTLQEVGFATLLLDLLTAAEEPLDDRTGRLRFDVGLLAVRLVHATAWLSTYQHMRNVRFGYFGASTGAAAALVAAAQTPGIAAIVSRGGRPDLAGPGIPQVHAPVLLIVGGEDRVVLDLNRQAQSQLIAESTLEVIPGATHLFEEPGALEQVATLARNWFERHLPQGES